MIDIYEEPLITLSEAAKLLPGRPAASTLWRWSRGLRGVRLATVLIGGKRYTNRSAIQKFSAALTAADNRTNDSLSESSLAPSKREKEIETSLNRERL